MAKLQLRASYGWLLSAVVLIYGSFNLARWNKQDVLKHDMFVYYSYLPATFIYQDLDFTFYQNLQEQGEKGEFWTLTAPNGKPVQKMSMGVAYCYVPFFLLGHAAAEIGPWEANGYTVPYHFSIAMAGLFYSLLGLFIAKKIVLKYVSESSAFYTVLALGLGTNLFYYSTSEAGMSHAFSFALIASFIWLTMKWWTSANVKNSILIGLISGLIVLIRPTNLLLAVPFLVYGEHLKQGLKQTLSYVLAHKVQVSVLVICALTVWIPQLLYWKTQTGDWWYYSYQGESFFWGDSRILQGLFSYRKGWLIYTPVMVLALLGLVLLISKQNPWKWALIIWLPIQLYITYSWWCWWYGGSFGQRVMIDFYALLAIPLALFIQYILKKKRKGIAALLIIFFVSFNLFQTFQYRKTLIHWDSMTKAAYWAIFLKTNFPENYGELIETPDYEEAKKGQR